MPRPESSRASEKRSVPSVSPVSRFPDVARRALGFLLLALVLLPWYRLVGLRGTGPAVDQTLRLGALYYGNGWIGALLTLAGCFLFGFVIPRRASAAFWEGAEEALLMPRASHFAVALGTVAATISLWVTRGVLHAKPALLDGVAQLVHARYLGAGMLAGPPLQDAEFWQFQFMVLSERGWVSQYPLGYAALLGLGEKLGAVWLIGPLLLGIAIGLTSLVAERLLPDDRTVARVGAALAASSPVLAFHAASYMNHVLALTLTALALYASLRALEGSSMWSLLSGAALGALFMTRPYSALVMGLFATVILWRYAPARTLQRADWTRLITGALAGSIPFVLATLLYNNHFFGAFARFGYEAAEGPGHRLGFHLDPWGNPYGPQEALGYTAADLQGLNLDLLQGPLPIVLLVGLYLVLLSPRIRGMGSVIAWAVLPVAAYALYWHHDLFMGPRLLYEALPGWCLLVAAAALGIVRALPMEGRRFGITRRGVSAALAFSLILSLAYSSPRKLASYASEGARSGMALAAPAVERASIVFVHGGWEDRVAARLAASGMRVDSIRAALAHNSTCELELYLAGVERDGSEPAVTSLRPVAFRADPSRPLRELRMPSGSVMHSFEGETLDPLCQREAASDFDGVVGLPPFLWQGDLPGLGTSGALFVRDFGPDRNARLLARFPERAPRALVRRRGEIALVDYDEVMTEMWGGQTGR